MDLPARRRAGLLRDRRLRRADRAGRDGAAARRPRGRPGPGRRPRRMIAIVWACAVAGDLTSFFLGRRLGRAFLVKHGPKVQITEERLEQVEGFFDRHGGKAILIGRFVGLVRAVAPFLAGSSGMPLRRFVPYDVIGAGLWGSTLRRARLRLLAELRASSSTTPRRARSRSGAVIVLVVAIVWLVRWLRDEEQPRAHARRGWTRQARAARAAPAGRACCAPRAAHDARGRRASSGTASPRATSASSSRRCSRSPASAPSSSWATSSRSSRTTACSPATPRSLRLADRLHADALVDVRQGRDARWARCRWRSRSWSSRRRRSCWRRELRDAGRARRRPRAHLRGGAHHQGRRRPPAAGARARRHRRRGAIPSGHAAYAVTWVAVAVALSRALPGLASRFAFVTVAIVIAVVVGLTPHLPARALPLRRRRRAGGWAPRSSRSAACAALVVGYVRNNARAPDATSDEQRVDHLPRRRVQRRLRPRRLRRPHPRARLDGLQPRLGAPGGRLPHALRAGRRSSDPGRRRAARRSSGSGTASSRGA